jgi:hypothetical protein
VIQLPTGTKIWIAAGVTDMRRGFDGLSAPLPDLDSLDRDALLALVRSHQEKLSSLLGSPRL